MSISDKHECSVPHCGLLIRSELLMCRDHWRLVPLPFQRRVLAAWEQYQRGRLSIDELREAQRLATEAVVAAEGGAV